MKCVILNWWWWSISVWSSNVSSCPQMEDRTQNMFTFNELTSQNRFGSDGQHVQTNFIRGQNTLTQLNIVTENIGSEQSVRDSHESSSRLRHSKNSFYTFTVYKYRFSPSFLKWQKFPIKCRKVTVFYESAVKVEECVLCSFDVFQCEKTDNKVILCFWMFLLSHCSYYPPLNCYSIKIRFRNKLKQPQLNEHWM